MPDAPKFDGPRLIQPGEEAASYRLAMICFGNLDPDLDQPLTMPTPAEDEGEPEGLTYVIAADGQPVTQISIFQHPLAGE